MSMIFFDTETTGLLVPEINKVDAQPYIVEIYACKTDDNFNLECEFYSRFKPPIPIPEETSKIHGIRNEDVIDCEPFKECVDELAEFFLGANKLIGHNLPYDRSMLANELIRCDRLISFPWPPVQVCTVEMSMPIEQRRMNLSKLHQRCTGRPHEGAHHAKDDVFALVRCYHWLVENGFKDNPFSYPVG